MFEPNWPTRDYRMTADERILLTVWGVLNCIVVYIAFLWISGA